MSTSLVDDMLVLHMLVVVVVVPLVALTFHSSAAVLGTKSKHVRNEAEKKTAERIDTEKRYR